MPALNVLQGHFRGMLVLLPSMRALRYTLGQQLLGFGRTGPASM